ncbi:MAG: fibronectin type III domain-containing protein [Acidobacteria bacterium]|nr:fibronectin type III domain-containing protein [Acidobacteriota bacterium]MYG75289.1 fibronectin type III domain-containing protein [Acidobacteriota bacterium]
MKTLAALALVLIVGAAGCGRRGPPLAPLQVDPETPRVLPLRQEDGAVVVRWYAPRLDSGGDPADLRLRKAVVSYRIVDLHALAAEERASQRQPPEEEEEEDTGAASAGDEDGAGVPEPEEPEPEDPVTEDSATEDPVTEDPVTEEPAAPDAAPATPGPETPAGEETPVPDAVPPETTEPGPVAVEEPSPAGGTPPGEAEAEPEQQPVPEEEPEPAPEPGGEPEPEPEGETGPGAAQEAEGPGEPAPDEAGGDTQEEAPEPEAAPEPEGPLLDYEELEFEVLSEIESEVPGEERVLELPVEPDWIGRRLEITVRYEARGGASEESELQSLDVTGPLPPVAGVLVEVGPRELTIRWQDPRGALGEAPLADPLFEVFRRRGGESERLGRSFGPTQTDADVVWGEEVCYRARLVVAGDAEERVIPDPGPVAPAGPAGGDSAGESPAPDETGEPGALEISGAEPGEPEEEAAAAPGEPEGEAATAPGEPEAEEAPWTPIPIRVPGAGTGALSVGPMSAEECVTPVDAFPPVPPSDLRLFWRAEATELSWRDSASTDVAGYHVYRSGPDGSGFERLTESPVEQTSYTDAARDPRGAYRYAVTAVDGADPPNESLPSDPRTANPR